jgi:hypothetical protein
VRWGFGYCGHYWPIVPAPADRWRWLWRKIGGMQIGRGSRSTPRKPAPAPLCPPTNPTWLDPGLNPGRRSGKLVINRLSYGAASGINLEGNVINKWQKTNINKITNLVFYSLLYLQQAYRSKYTKLLDELCDIPLCCTVMSCGNEGP